MIDEVVVTAERRASTAQRTAASVSVRSGDDMLAQGRYSLQSILDDVPGVNGGISVNSGTGRSASDNPAGAIVIRGIQSNLGASGSSIAPAASAALYVDDVYNGLGNNYDVDRLEILRGPQGTLYGRSATSGVVAVRTRNPDLTSLGGNLTLEGGNYGTRHASGAINLPLLTDKLALRLSANHYAQDGFYSNTGGGRRVTNEGRAKLLFKPTDNFSALIGAAFQDNATRSDGVTINQVGPDVFDIVDNEWRPSWDKYRQVWGEFNIDLGSVGITYIPAYRSFKQDSKNLTRGTVKVDQIGNTPTDTFHTEELRLHSNATSALQWQVGGMYYQNTIKGDFNQVNFFPSGALAFRSLTNKRTTAIGAFAEGVYSLTPATRVTAGLRYDHTKVATEQDYTGPAPPTKYLRGEEGIRRFDNITYKLRLEQDLTPDNLAYASVSTGFAPGDVSVTTNASGQPQTVELQSQTLTAYEVGSKNRFAGGKVQINASAYYYDYGGYQVANINLAPAGATRTYNTITLPLRVYGGELELKARPWAGGQFSADLSYTHARYHDIPARYDYLFAFNDVPGVPPFEANGSYTHTFALTGGAELRLTGDVRYTAEHYVTRVADAFVRYGTLDYAHVGGKMLGDLNATLALAGGRYSISGYVRNVTDERFKVYRPGLGTTIDSASAAGVGSTVYFNDPRTYGLVFTAQF